MACTGVIIFVHPEGMWKPLHEVSKEVHVWSGFVFIGFAALHTWFNFKTLLVSIERRGRIRGG